MRELTKLTFNPIVEKVSDILTKKTQNEDPLFFRILVSYYLAKLASMMRVQIKTDIFETSIPVNMYAINLAVSGSGKGRSINILEDQIINQFRSRFMRQTFPLQAKKNIENIALKRSVALNTNQTKESDKLNKEFEENGAMAFSFDSGTTAAVKQMRHKLLLAGAGSMNLEIDEIGSNLLGQADVLSSFLELYDMGKIKQKLVKSTKDNARMEELWGATPANMMLLGTPTKLLDGSKTEQEFIDMLETGYARRAFFGFSKHKHTITDLTPETIYDMLTDTSSAEYLAMLSDQFKDLADPVNFKTVLKLDKQVTLELLDYRHQCDIKADTYSDFEEVRKAELKHRYFKSLKLAGSYAFAEKSMEVTKDHLYQAIAMAEESGNSFESILKRDRSYVRLASYICTIGRPVTQADLVEDLPFYKGTEAQKKEMLQLAISYGYNNNMLIKRENMDGIEMIDGKSYPETDLTKILVSYSVDITTGYKFRWGNWANMQKLCTANGMHWCNHMFKGHKDHPGKGGYRDEEHTEPGFNLAVIDVDNAGISTQTAKDLLEDYTFFLYTTKRHTSTAHRFRIVFPLSHVLTLEIDEYKAFMQNLYEWLPFEVDRQTDQRSRKWLSNPGSSLYNTGKLLDAFQFFPKTKKAEELRAKLANQTNFSNVERWYYNKMEEGNRNNILLRYALHLVDAGLNLDAVKNSILALNNKIDKPLPEAEIFGTIMITVSKKIAEKHVQP